MAARAAGVRDWILREPRAALLPPADRRSAAIPDPAPGTARPQRAGPSGASESRGPRLSP